MKPAHSIFCFVLPLFVWGQNLVKNPSFEDYETCPNALGTFKQDVADWTTPTLGTTDYFNTCSKVMGAPENFNGIQQPKYDNAYAGLYFYAPADYREYIQAPLKKALQKGDTYVLSFYISLAEGSDFAVKDFGVVLSYNALNIATKKQLSRKHLFTVKGNRVHTFEVNHPKFHEDKTDWLLVTTEFEAKGFEKYLILGNLRSNKLTRKVQTKRKETKKGAYYYIDMVSLRNKHRKETIVPEVEKSERIVIENVLFEFDLFTLTDEAKNELAIIQQKLVDSPELLLEIHGHTDDQGTVSYNKKLSEKRAKAIADYIVEQGVAIERISWFGHGSGKPMADNTTETGRAKNRRAEFLFRTQ